jgi:hypothetical protein
VRRLLTFIVLAIPAWSAFGEQWTSLTPLPDGYQEHILLYANGFLYNIGGVSASNGEINGTNVFYSQVYSNGTIGNWSNTTPLPEAVFDSAGVADSGFVYVISGDHYIPAVGDFLTNTVYYAEMNSDGSLGNWETANSLPQAVFFLGAAVWNHTIYAVGGTTDFNAVDNIYSARIQGDGSLSAWESQTALPAKLDSAVTAVNGGLYLIGGIANGGGIQQQTYYSKINAGGTLASWNRTTDYPQYLANVAGVATSGRLFCFGGFNGSAAISNCYSAAVLGDGSMGAWSVATSLPQPLTFHAAGTGGSYVFVSGGNNNFNTCSTVYSMPLPPLPVTPVLTSQRMLTNQTFQLRLTSSTNIGFEIQTSTNLTNWTKIGWGFTDTNGLLIFQDTNAAEFSNRFYRAYWPLP